jgi:hypothetical protein
VVHQIQLARALNPHSLNQQIAQITVIQALLVAITACSVAPVEVGRVQQEAQLQEIQVVSVVLEFQIVSQALQSHMQEVEVVQLSQVVQEVGVDQVGVVQVHLIRALAEMQLFMEVEEAPGQVVSPGVLGFKELLSSLILKD